MRDLFIQSAQKVLPEIFQQMLQLNPVAVGLAKYGDGAKPPYNISTIIGIKGPDFAGFVSLNMTAEVAMKCAANMLGMEFTTMNDDVKDAAGEITNVVVGNMKTDLNAKGIKFEITVPTVVTGDHIALHALREIEPVCVVFSLPEGKISVEFGTKKV